MLTESVQSSMRRLIHFAWREKWQILRFILIGGLSFVLSTGLYYAFSRFFWPAGNRTLENFIAIAIACVFNFLAHRFWTFNARHQTIQQMYRYLFVAISAMLLQSFLFWLGHEVLRVYDLAVIVIVTGIIAVYTYCLHRWFTFRKPADVL